MLVPAVRPVCSHTVLDADASESTWQLKALLFILINKQVSKRGQITAKPSKDAAAGITPREALPEILTQHRGHSRAYQRPPRARSRLIRRSTRCCRSRCRLRPLFESRRKENISLSFSCFPSVPQLLPDSAANVGIREKLRNGVSLSRLIRPCPSFEIFFLFQGSPPPRREIHRGF